MALLYNFWSLFLVSAPWLMLGLLLAGLLNVFIPKNFLKKHLGKEGIWTTIKAALIGAPMPLCSCGVIPAAVGLRRAGGSKSATTAFLVSTPETGVDSVSVSYVLLGPFMAVIRPIAAVSSAIVAGLLVGKDKKQTVTCEEATSLSTNVDSAMVLSCCEQSSEAPVEKQFCDINSHQAPKDSSCCSHNSSDTMELRSIKNDEALSAKSICCAIEPIKSQNKQQDSLFVEPQCCSATHETQAEKPSDSSDVNYINSNALIYKFKQAIHFSCNKLLNDTMGWLMIGLFFAALVQTYVPASFLSQWGDGILAMMVVILVSIPMYICATASTPIAAGLLMAGVSPGAVLVFMLAGPATNIATLGVVSSELGKRAVSAYLLGVVGVAVLFGFLTDFLIEQYGFKVDPVHAMEHELMPSWLITSLGVMLLCLMVRLVFISLKKRVKI